MAFDREFSFRITSEIANLEKVRNWAAGVARAARFDERAVFEVELSVYEACANVIEHAYRNNPTHYIDLKIAVRNERLIVTILDEGGIFNSSMIKDKDIARIIQTEQNGGLGVFIMEACMDEILYRRHDGRNILELVKYLPQSAPA